MDLQIPSSSKSEIKTSLATFGGGCFWCLQQPFDEAPGVLQAVVGYMGGARPNPTYEQICTGVSGHVEVIQISFDPEAIHYRDLLEIFWRNIDPSNGEGQFADRGTQYRPVIFFHDENQKKDAEFSRTVLEKSRMFPEIAVAIERAVTFWPGEEYHQGYYLKCPLKYQSYKVGSGRAAFIKRAWDGKSWPAQA